MACTSLDKTQKQSYLTAQSTERVEDRVAKLKLRIIMVQQAGAGAVPRERNHPAGGIVFAAEARWLKSDTSDYC